jgi:CRISPR-associated protein Cas1
MDKNFYLFKNGRLSRKDHSIDFQFADDSGHKYLPVEGMGSLYAFGEIDLNSKLVNFLGQNGIPIHFFNYYGFYTGSFYPKETQVSGFLLVNQVAHYSDPQKRLELAQKLILGAAYTITENLKYYANKDRNLDDPLQRISGYTTQIETCSTIPELMGIEGNIRHTYYQAFEAIIIQKIDFKKRVKNPPDNMINSLISYMNSLVYTTCLSEIYKTQLNPTVSFLHEPGSKRFSLSLDLAEIFKPLLADRIIFSVLNKKQITESDFEKDSEYVFLTEKARKVLLQEYDEKLQTTVKHRQLKRSVSYQYLIRLECYKLIKHILGESPYESFKVMW